MLHRAGLRGAGSLTQTSPGVLKGLEISQRGAGLEIARRWFNDGTILLTVFAVIWNGFTVPFFLVMRLHPAAEEGLSLFHLVLYTLPSIGILLAYRAAAEWLNRTWIVIDPEYVCVRHGPLPWPVNRKLRAAQISRLHTRTSPWGRGKGQYRRYTYDVLAEVQDGKTLKLAGGFPDVDQAVRVKQEIEGRLGLKPAQGAPQGIPAPEDRDTYIETALESAQQGHQAVAGPKDPETNIQSVLAIWLFIILWNGVVWSVALMLWDSPRLKNAEVGLVFFAFFALIGFGLICLAIPATWRFFRQAATRRPNPATRKSGWFAVICVLAIAAGFALILTAGMRMHDKQDAPLRQLQAPATGHR